MFFRTDSINEVTLLDIFNYILQVMEALISFYLNNDFIHRDVKGGNILVGKNGIIQIIDNGSVAPHSKAKHAYFEYDLGLRSTHFVDYKIFFESP
jgi:serine/threonine protein kinase